VVSASILCAGCREKAKPVVHDTTSMNVVDFKAMAAAIQAQYASILNGHRTEESLIIQLSDHSATLVINVQDKKIIMAQLTLRNPYPNNPDLAPTPYTDIHGDGILETYPADTRTLPQSSLTYGNYLAILTHFGLPKEVIQESVLPQKNLPKSQ